MMRKTLSTLAVAAVSVVGFATDYNWTGGANDGGLWTTPGNWNVESGYPNANVDRAIFNGDATVSLNTGTATALRVFKVTAGTVTLNGTSGSKLNFTKGTADSIVSGFDVAENAVLNLNAPFTGTKRTDVYGKGTVNFSSEIKDIGEVSYIRSQFANFGTGAKVEMSKALSFGSTDESRVTLADDAQISFTGANFMLAYISSSAKNCYFTQDGVQTKVSTTLDFHVNVSATTYPMQYVLKAGSVEVGGNLNASNKSTANGKSVFLQQGGVATVAKDILVSYGDVKVCGGEMTVDGSVADLSGVTGTGEVLVSGGKLTITDGKSVGLKAPVRVRGGNLALGTKTVSGRGKVSVEGNLGTVELLGTTTWEQLLQMVQLETGAVLKVKLGEGAKLTTESAVVSETMPFELEVEDLSQLEFCAETDIRAFRLSVGGQVQPEGQYSAKNGFLTVAAPDGAYVWKGSSGGNWTASANWKGGLVPNGATAEVDLHYSVLPGSINLDGAITLKSLRTTENLVLTGSDALKIAQDGFIAVGDGVVLTCSAPVRIVGSVEKREDGKVIFSNGLRCDAELDSLEFPNENELRTVCGETVVACEVEGLRIHPCSADSLDVPVLRIAEGAVLTNKVCVNGPYAGHDKVAYGDVIVDGGTIDFESGKGLYGMNGKSDRGSAEKWCFAWFLSGVCNFTVNGGTFVTPSGYSVLMNLNNTASGGGTIVVLVNGGSLTLSKPVYLGVQGAANDSLVLQSGKLTVDGFLKGNGANSTRRIELKGGELVARQSVPAGFLIAIDGIVELNQKVGGNNDFTINAPISGTGTIVQKGLSSVFFKGEVADYAGAWDVRSGVVSFGTDCGEFSATSDIVVASGAKLDLDYEGTRTVHALTLGTRQANPGRVYGAAVRKTKYFTGTGLIEPLTGPDPSGALMMVR